MILLKLGERVEPKESYSEALERASLFLFDHEVTSIVITNLFGDVITVLK